VTSEKLEQNGQDLVTYLPDFVSACAALAARMKEVAAGDGRAEILRSLTEID